MSDFSLLPDILVNFILFYFIIIIIIIIIIIFFFFGDLLGLFDLFVKN